jgi:hypothetical protein
MSFGTCRSRPALACAVGEVASVRVSFFSFDWVWYEALKIVVRDSISCHCARSGYLAFGFALLHSRIETLMAD